MVHPDAVACPEEPPRPFAEIRSIPVNEQPKPVPVKLPSSAMVNAICSMAARDMSPDDPPCSSASQATAPAQDPEIVGLTGAGGGGGGVPAPDCASSSPSIFTSVPALSRENSTSMRALWRDARMRTRSKSPLKTALSQPAAATRPPKPERLARLPASVPVNVQPKPLPLT